MQVVEYASAEIAAHGAAGIGALVIAGLFAAACIYLASWIPAPPPEQQTLQAQERQAKKNNWVMLIVIILFIAFAVMMSLGAVPFVEG